MEWENIKSNNIEGDSFIFGVIEIENKWQKARELFTKFVQMNGFSTWHIHDGWVMNNNNSGDILHYKDIQITWVDKHTGHSHTGRCPNVGEKIVIINHSPKGSEIKPFDLYCYEVVGKEKRLFDEIKLKQIEIKKVVFNLEENNYQFYVKEHGAFFRFLKRIINN